VVATVNGEEISRDELARECLRQHGEAVLESLVNKRLIAQECARRNIVITEAEVRAEIENIANRFSLAVEQLFKMLREERNIDPQQYAEDIIWPILALRKLAGSQMEVTREELLREYEARYGPAVKVRLIVCNDLETARRIRSQALADPSQFGVLARQHSVDTTSASVDGLVQPVRRHLGPKEIEEAAFNLPDGAISEVIPLANQYLILKREGMLPASNLTFEQVKMRLVEIVRDRKIREVGAAVFQQLQQQAQVVNVWNDSAQSQKMPGVAALVNGEQILVRELAEVCLDRHGSEVLEGMIYRRLIEQACRRQRMEISEGDLDAEIARAASTMLPPKPDGSPDLEKWIALYTQQQGISEAVYRSEVVWPAVALRKLVRDRVTVTDEDLQKGFEANYGPRVRCLAIVLDDLRRAQKVWEMARSNPTREYFGQLAAEYSIDPAGRALRGEVPPIQKHGGQPILEREAFRLRPGELSGIIDVGANRFVILLCEGYTAPVDVEFTAVRDLLYEDILEKKTRLEMNRLVDELHAQARIVNFLSGTSTRPPAETPGTIVPTQAVTPLPQRR